MPGVTSRQRDEISHVEGKNAASLGGGRAPQEPGFWKRPDFYGPLARQTHGRSTALCKCRSAVHSSHCNISARAR